MGTLSQDGKPAKTRDSFRLLNTFFFFLSGPVANSKNMFFLMISKNRKSSFSGVWKTKNNYFWMIWKDVFVFFSYAASAKQISLKNTIFFESNNIENHEITSFFAIWKRILFFGFCKRNKLIFWSFEHAKQWFFKILKNAKHCFCFFFFTFWTAKHGFLIHLSFKRNPLFITIDISVVVGGSSSVDRQSW